MSAQATGKTDMPRYFFDLCNGAGWLPDDEGINFADSDEMRAEAMGSVRSLIASDIRDEAKVNLAHFLSVRDEEGNEIYRLHFRDAVEIQDIPPEG